MKNNFDENNAALLEAYVLYFLLKDNETRENILSRVNETMFSDFRVSAAIKALREREVSTGEVTLELLSTSISDSDVVFSLIEDIRRIDSEVALPTWAYAKDYTEKFFRNCALQRARRTLSFCLEQLQQGEFASEDEVNVFIAKQLEEATVLVNLKGAIKDASQLSNDYYDNIAKMRDDAERGLQVGGIKSGFKRLDEITTGFHPAQLVVVGARPGIGKTAFALNIAENISFYDNKKKVLFFSLEMSEKQVMDRLTSIHIQTNAQELQQPHLIPEVKWNRLGGALEKIGKADFYLYSDSNSSADYIVNLIKKTIVKEKISIVVIDYLQLLEGSKNRSEQNRVYELSAITRALKNISRNFGVTVILLSQLSRDIEKRTDPTPRLSDLRDSGSIEQDSDIVVFLHKKPEVESFGKEQVKEVIVTVAKHRSGPLGTFNLGFIPEYTRFENLAN